jgi:hypothetical protein
MTRSVLSYVCCACAQVAWKRVLAFAAVFVACTLVIKQLGDGGTDDDSHIFKVRCVQCGVMMLGDVCMCVVPPAQVLLVRLGVLPHNDDFQIRIYTSQVSAPCCARVCAFALTYGDRLSSHRQRPR